METKPINTLIQLLEVRSQDPAKGIVFVEKNGKEEFLSYAELRSKAGAVLHLLQQRGIHAGAELVIQLEDNKTFIIVFWACILGGIIAVPLSVGKTELNQQKLFNVWDMLIDPFLFTTPDILERNEKTITGALNANIITAMRHSVIFDHEIMSDHPAGNLYHAEETDIAFLQFSSGSTGNSKGVILTHANLLANLEGIHRAAGYTAADISLSWMPLTHDMGLIGFHLNPLYSNMNQYLLPTALFIVRPSIWLDKCAEHRVTITCSPNFGYSYVLRHTGKIQEDIDLSSIRIIYNGAEPISFDLCQSFLQAFARYNLKATAMCPVYGLAEATLAVTISDPLLEAASIQISRQHTGIGEQVKPPINQTDALTLVNVGVPIHQMQLRITDLQDRAVGEGIAGVIQISGPSVTAGYYNNPESTKAVRKDGEWLSTGDTGIIINGALYILGRIKDVLFVNGQNYYAHDLEKIAQEVPGIELNKIAVAGVFDQQTRRDEIIAFILYRNSLESFATLAASVNECVMRKTGFALDTIIPVKEIPKTTSGKLQRYQLAEQYANGVFDNIKNELLQYTLPTKMAQEIPASGTTEQRFLRLCGAILRQSSISVTDHFSTLGGDSLRAVALSMAIWKEFGAEISVDEIYAADNLQRIIFLIQQKKDSNQYRPVAKAPEMQVYTLSALQTGIYNYCSINADSLTYNVPVLFRLRSGYNCSVLEKGIQDLISRHEVLRTAFNGNGSSTMQVHPDVSFQLQVIKTTVSDIATSVKKQIRPFDLSRSPLLQACVLECDNGPAYFFMDVHHLIADGISVTILLQELLSFCNQQLPAEPVLQYRDYCFWEKEQQETEAYGNARLFWEQYLNEELPLLEMPVDFLRPPFFSGKGKRMNMELQAELTGQIISLIRNTGRTLHSFFFTAYSLLLNKFTGQEEMMIGIPVSGRMHPDLAAAVGMFVNSLPVKVKLNGSHTFIAEWEKIAAGLRTVIGHQQYPFSSMTENLQQRRDVSRNPFFDTMFVYQNMPMEFLQDTTLFAERIPVDAGVSKYDLSLEIIEEKGQFSVSLEYATDLFREETMQLFLQYYIQLLGNITRSPEIPLQSLSVLLPEQRSALGTSIAAQALNRYSTTIAHLLDDSCRDHKDRIALSYKGSNLSYAEFGNRVNGAAIKLRQYGIAKGDVVALSGARSPELVVAMMAVLKAGACFLPIDTHLPQDRVEYMLGNSGCKLLITDRVFAESGTTDIQIIPFQELESAAMHPNLPVSSEPGDLCYILYTSGTTGLPKGVMIEHHSLVNYVKWGSSIYCNGKDSHFPFFTSISFDLTLTSVFIPLLTGNTVVIYDDAADEFLLKQVLEENKATVIKATPSHLRLLVNNYQPPKDSRVRAFIVGGEQLESRLAEQLYRLFEGKVTIYNEYGPTEGTIGCMTYTFDPAVSYQNVPIGVAAANTHIYVLDQRLQPVPDGVKGEIYIAGAGLARGYHNNEVLTAERFIANPFCAGERMYRTGDIGRLIGPQLISYCGRIDEQVKINGHRIELSEIQLLITSDHRIQDAVVIVRKGRNGQPFLCAFYTTKGNENIDGLSGELKKEAMKRLPYYMVPAHFVRLDSIPLTRNQKTDIRALESYQIQTDALDTVLTVSAMEAILLTIWKEILQEPTLGTTDNFFEFGGDSIKAIQIVAAARQKGITLTVKDILTAHTVQHLANYAEVQQETFSRKQEEGHKPFSPIEKWFFSQQLAFPGAYNQAVLLKSTIRLDFHALKQSICWLIQHHDALRLNLDVAGNRLFFNSAAIEDRLIVLQKSLEEQAPVAEKITAASGLQQHVFDLTKDILLAASVITTGNGDEFIYLTAHHLVTDGITWHILLHDLQHLYKAQSNGDTESVLLRAPVSVKEWLAGAETNARENSNVAIRELCNRADSCVMNIPSDFETADWRMLHAKTTGFHLSAATTDCLRKQGSVLFHTDMETILYFAVSLALQDWTGQQVLKFEAESHGRDSTTADLSATAGWFTELFPLVIDITKDDILKQLKSIKEQIIKAKTISPYYGFLKYGQTASNAAPFSRPEIRLNYLGEFGVQNAGDLFHFVYTGMRIQSVTENTLSAKLELNAMIHQGELIAELIYNETIHREETISQFVHAVQHNLERIADALSREKEIHFTPSDFSGVELSEEEIDSLFS